MGILDVLRPKWRHSDPAVRRSAALTGGDPVTLAALAKDPDSTVRLAAASKLEDASLLAPLSQRGDGN